MSVVDNRCGRSRYFLTAKAASRRTNSCCETTERHGYGWGWTGLLGQSKHEVERGHLVGTGRESTDDVLVAIDLGEEHRPAGLWAHTKRGLRWRDVRSKHGATKSKSMSMEEAIG